MFQKLKDDKSQARIKTLNDAEEVLGRDLFLKLKSIESSVKLDHTIFGFFDWCQIMNEVLSEFAFFLILRAEK